MFRRSSLVVALVATFSMITPGHAAPPIPNPPDTKARGYLLQDFQTGRILAEQNADERLEPASLTKIMAAYVVFKALRENRLKLTDMVVVSENAWRTGGSASGGSTTFLEVGSSVPVEVLVKGMIVQSGNDATIALAERLGGTEAGFVQIMNSYAKQLGMKNTNFENSAGLPGANHYTTARDMATLARAIIREFPDYYRYYSLREFTWNNHTQQNRNGLLGRDPSVDGMKTGHTESAGYCLVTSANRDGMRLVSVVMGTPSIKEREAASAALLNYGYTFYETAKIKGRGDVVATPRVFKSAEAAVPVTPQRDVYITLPRGDAATLKTDIRVNDPLVAPLAANAAVGEMTVSDAKGTVLVRVPLAPAKAVAEGGMWSRLSDTVALWFH